VSKTLAPGPVAWGLMGASGFAGLAYQVVWTQQAALWLGHETAAVLAVIAAFFAGLALGALALAPRIERSACAGRWYAACEAAVGLWGLALVGLMPAASSALLALTGPQPDATWQWSVAFGGTFAVLLPATAAMGATLPAMQRALAGLACAQQQGGSIAALYACNTLGATLGVLACAFWLVPTLGLARTAICCAALNFLVAGAALWLFPTTAAAGAPTPQRERAGTAWVLAATGVLGIGYEVLVVRVLSQVSENTVYTFALLLAVYLVGTALGAAAYAGALRKTPDPDRLRGPLFAAQAAACLLGTASLWGAEALKHSALQVLGPGMGPALAAEAALALAAFLPPTMVMGALFSHLAAEARAQGVGFGRALGINTLGAAAAPALFGVWLVPAVGPKTALLLVAAAYLVLGLRGVWNRPSAWAVAGGIGALALWAPPLAFVDVPEGGHIVDYREGAMAAVSVVQDAQGVLRLRINNRQQEGSSATRLADGRQALLPLLLHPDPRRALFLGLGTGVTVRAAAEDPALHVDAVELLPEVIQASARFVAPGAAAPPGLHVMAADARRQVRVMSDTYDVIVSDNFHPARSGSAALYTVEHFRAVHARLAAGGLFCQWLPVHQLDLSTLRSIVAAYLTAYPGAYAVLATHSLDTPVLGLVGRAEGGSFDRAQLQARLSGPRAAAGAASYGFDDDFAVLGSFVAGPAALARLATGAPVNTDDRPVVSHLAPRITYAPELPPRERLVALLPLLGLSPGELLGASADAQWSPRLAAYWAARDRYLEAGLGVQPTADVRAMLAQVRSPLLEVLKLSPDFRPAYDPLLRMAEALGSVDRADARDLLSELVHVQPMWPDAVQALRRLEGPWP
jgi:spermidine synthase